MCTALANALPENIPIVAATIPNVRYKVASTATKLHRGAPANAKAKDEYVVNAPKKPVPPIMRNSSRSGQRGVDTATKPVKNPNSSAPKVFANAVLNGKISMAVVP